MLCIFLGFSGIMNVSNDCFGMAGDTRMAFGKQSSFGEKLHERLHACHERHIHHHHHKEFRRYHQYFRYFRPAAAIFSIIILYMLFTWGGLKGLGIFFGILIALKEIAQFLFLLRLERRLILPVEKLRECVDEVANGNYHVQVEYDSPNDLGLLIASFNEMARQLAEDEKIKAEYEENRKMLITSISHDLKTPITAIQGYIEALLDERQSTLADREKYLQIIHNNTLYMNNLIDDLFLFAKLDMQKLELHFLPIPIRSFMSDLLEEFRLDLTEQNISFVYDCKLEEEAILRIDGKRLRQAITNLIGNAVKHADTGRLEIVVSLYRCRNEICLSIADNGPGIPADKLPHIFDRFYRVDKERTKHYGSTGLGLAIARELVEAHGGTIAVVSAEKQGTSFTVSLPMAEGGTG